MTKTKSTKRALLMSALALLMCVSMLVGSTFAWFTDSVTTAGNTIQSGTLKVDLVDKEGKSLAGEVLEFVDQDENDLWEPGCTYTLEEVYVENKGNLALKYTIAINGITGDAKLLEAIEWTIKVDGVTTNLEDLNGFLLPNTKTGAIVLTGHMKEEAGNEYQGLTADGISISVFATQFNSESDSFGPDYDKAAPLLVWDGTVDTSWYDDSATTYELSSPAKLAGLAKLVNEGNSFAGKTIKLAADMDLNNLKWTAIGTGTANFNGKFYGNGFTIYNLNVSGTKGVGLIGFAGNAAHIEGVHIVGANVTGVNSVGAVLGYGYLAKDCLKNCIVEDAIVYAAAGDSKEDGDKVGSVAGWTSNGNINGNKAINCEIYGCRDMGGIVGYVNGENRAVEVSGNTVENVTVSVIKAEGYDANKLGSNINDTVGRTGSRVTVQSNNGKIVKNVDVAAASTSDELKKVITNNTEVVLTGGEFSLPSLSGKEGVTLIGSAGTVIGGGNTSTGFGSNFGKNTTVKNITFSGTSNGVRYSYAQGGTSVFENCTFAGDSVYGFHIDSSHGATFIFNNCTFSGFNAFAGDLAKVTFNNCTFLSNGNYGHTNIWSLGEFNNCTWGDETSVSPAGGSGKLYFDGVEESYHHEFIGSADSLFAFAKSVNEGGDSWKGQKVLLVADIDLNNAAWTPIGQTGATEFRGIFDGQNHTIKNLYVDNSAYTDELTSTGLFGWAESGVTIQNVKVDGASVKGNHNVAVIVGYTYSGKIANCHVSNASVICNHANDDACGDKAGTIAGYTADEARLSDCTASDSTVTAGRDAGQLFGLAYTKSVSNCSATNVVVSATGECTGANINNALIGRVMG